MCAQLGEYGCFGIPPLLLFVFMGRAIENFAVYHKNNKICIIIIYIRFLFAKCALCWPQLDALHPLGP